MISLDQFEAILKKEAEQANILSDKDPFPLKRVMCFERKMRSDSINNCCICDLMEFYVLGEKTESSSIDVFRSSYYAWKSL